MAISQGDKTFWIAAPSAKRYDSGRGFRNNPTDFMTVSVTGLSCALNCAHCGGQLLKHMVDVHATGSLIPLGRRLRDAGALGLLVSGGALSDGGVPLRKRVRELAALKEMGLKLVLHTGFVDDQTASELRSVGVDQVLIDLIADQQTIRDVYRLPYEPGDYRLLLERLCAYGLNVVPHVVAGLRFGEVTNGEIEAVRWASQYPVTGLVLVVLAPLPGTQMCKVEPPAPNEIGELLSMAREELAEKTLLLGCARPANSDKLRLERVAVENGVDGMAYASPETIDYVQSLGRPIQYFSGCCSLLAGQI